MKVSIIIVNYNVKYFLELCLHSVQQALQGIDAEIIVVDNNSSDGSEALVKEKFPEVIFIANKDNKGFSKANNQAYAIAKGEYILFLNPDTVLPEDFFTKTIDYLDAHPLVGGIGPRLIDGKGIFAPDAKKSFPTLSVALFKATGINKIFSRSAYFNRYYAVHINEQETADVEVLSGCCMMMRKTAVDKAGGAFDEDYFMYFEDGDLCYRIRKAGFSNVYFPQTTVVHYKGESTKKATLSYVKIFNEAFTIFARKHYGASNARLFLFFINIGVVLRAIISAFKLLLNTFRMPLLDAIVLFLTLFAIKDFYLEKMINIPAIPAESLYITFPVYTLIWVLSLYLNGAYDQPYRGLRSIRGMVIGTVLCLAYFGLLPTHLRYSRAIIIFTGAAGGFLLLTLHESLIRSGFLKMIAFNELPKKAIIIGDIAAYQQTASILAKVHYAPHIYGRVGVNDEAGLTTINELKPLLYSAGIDEVIFCAGDISYKAILDKMQECGEKYDYKIHLPASQSFVGSNSSHTAGDLYTADTRYNLSRFASQRNKRMLDIVIAALLLLLSPILAIWVQKPFGFVGNCCSVLLGRHTWVGYNKQRAQLPVLKPAITPPYQLQEGFVPSAKVQEQMDISYAQYYSATLDLNFIFTNLKFLGRKK